jgi:hypothetical protein
MTPKSSARKRKASRKRATKDLATRKAMKVKGGIGAQARLEASSITVSGSSGAKT